MSRCLDECTTSSNEPPVEHTTGASATYFGRSAAIILGAMYVFVVGWMVAPHGLQAAIIVCAWVTACAAPPSRTPREAVPFALCAVIFSLFLIVTTNQLVVVLLWLGVLLSLLMHAAAGVSGTVVPGTAAELLLSTMKLIGGFAAIFFNGSTVRAYIVRRRTAVRPSGSQLAGIVLALPFLLVFHLLFAVINDEYRDFTAHVFELIWWMIKLVLDLELLQQLLQSALVGYVFFAMLNTRAGTVPLPGETRSLTYTVVKYVLGSVITLFLLFSYFQSQLLGMNTYELSFKVLSQYVQRGFWELLLVAGVGYLLILVVLRKGVPQPEMKRVRKLLVIFLLELLLITVFAQHKLFIHQLIFGLKDTRVMAAAAVLLIALTFVLSLLKLAEKISDHNIFRCQCWALLGTIALAAVVNLEAVVTTLHPIRYFRGNEPVKDYSYLLTNSYDNYLYWPQLMQEAQRIGVQPISNYYWGSYGSLCAGRRGRRNFEARLQYLTDAYAGTARNAPLRTRLRYNIREHAAYKLFTERNEEFRRFSEYLDAACAAMTGQRSRDWQ